MKINWTDEQTEAMKRLYGQFVKPGSLVFNVGANVGTRTRVFLDLEVAVVAVEPQHEMVLDLMAIGVGRFVRDGKRGVAVWSFDIPFTGPHMGRKPQLRSDDYGLFSHDLPDFVIVEAAAGPACGLIDLHLCTDNQLATCAPGWAEALQDRWPMEKWQEKITVAQTTLDSLIKSCGQPDFIKIDVEGYEREVIQGLSSRVPCLCFEATIPFVEPAIECVEDLAGRLGFTLFNYLVQERMELVLEEWVDAEGMVEILRGLPESTFYCDVFAR